MDVTAHSKCHPSAPGAVVLLGMHTPSTGALGASIEQQQFVSSFNHTVQAQSTSNTALNIQVSQVKPATTYPMNTALKALPVAAAVPHFTSCQDRVVQRLPILLCRVLQECAAIKSSAAATSTAVLRQAQTEHQLCGSDTPHTT